MEPLHNPSNEKIEIMHSGKLPEGDEKALI